MEQHVVNDRIIDHLRLLADDQRITLNELGSKIKPEFRDEDLPWIQKLVQGLAKDGLLDYAENGVRLP